MGPLRVPQYLDDWLELTNKFCEPLLPRLLGGPIAGGAAARQDVRMGLCCEPVNW